MSIAAQVIASIKLQMPLVLLVVTGLVVLVMDVWVSQARRWMMALVSLIGVALALGALFLVGPQSGEAALGFFGGLKMDYIVFLVQILVLAAAAFTLLVSPRYLEGRQIPQGEYYALILFAVASMLGLAASTELLLLFLHVEMVSIALYVLAGIEKRNVKSTEAAFKYFLLGSFAAAFLLLGIGYVFGGSGFTRYDQIAQAIASHTLINGTLFSIGIVLVLVGFAFKLTLAPFHMYAPDLYEGSPTPITALVATGSKVAAFCAMFSFVKMIAPWADLPPAVWAAVWVVTAISMVVGNVGAVIQPNIKRLLAYSSISHSAYTMLPIVVMLAPNVVGGPDMGNISEAVVFYLLAYTVMTLLAFGVAVSLGAAGEGPISKYAGLASKHPVLALLMTISLLSLIGIPPTIGFFGKLKLLRVAVDAHHYWLAVILGLTSVMSAFYYLKIIVTMWMREPEAEGVPNAEMDGVNILALGICTVALFLFAFVPSAFLFKGAP